MPISPDTVPPPAVDEAAEAPARRLMVGAPLPAVLDLKALEGVLGLSAARIWRLYQGGDFDFAVLSPTVGNKPRFSGKKIQAWLDGEDLTRPAAPRLFRKGTPR